MPPTATGVKQVAKYLPLLARWHREDDHLTPVARHYLTPPPGSAQEKLLAAVDARYTPREAFFNKVAVRLQIRQDSASKAFYGFIDNSRPLPARHHAAYLNLLKIDPAVLVAIAAERQPTTLMPHHLDSKLRDHLDEQHEAVLARLEALESTLRKVAVAVHA